MNSMPGGLLEPPPPVSRIAMGGIAWLMTGVFCAAWAGLGALGNLTTPTQAQTILARSIKERVRQDIVEALNDPRQQQSDTILVDDDLVRFEIARATAQDVNVPSVVAQGRAKFLYEHGLPPLPNKPTQTVLPRAVLGLMTARQHQRMHLARNAALIGVAASMLVCAAMATGAARFGLPGAGALLGYILIQYHIVVFNFWVETSKEGGRLFRSRLRNALFQPGRQLAFAAIALLVAGFVYSALIGGTRTVARERRRRKAKAKSAPIDEVGD